MAIRLGIQHVFWNIVNAQHADFIAIIDITVAVIKFPERWPFVVCFVVLGDQTQGLECARQTLHAQSIKKFFNLRPSKDVKGIVEMFALTLRRS